MALRGGPRRGWFRRPLGARYGSAGGAGRGLRSPCGHNAPSGTMPLTDEVNSRRPRGVFLEHLSLPSLGSGRSTGEPGGAPDSLPTSRYESGAGRRLAVRPGPLPREMGLCRPRLRWGHATVRSFPCHADNHTARNSARILDVQSRVCMFESCPFCPALACAENVTQQAYHSASAAASSLSASNASRAAPSSRSTIVASTSVN